MFLLNSAVTPAPGNNARVYLNRVPTFSGDVIVTRGNLYLNAGANTLPVDKIVTVRDRGRRSVAGELIRLNDLVRFIKARLHCDTFHNVGRLIRSCGMDNPYRTVAQKSETMGDVFDYHLGNLPGIAEVGLEQGIIANCVDQPGDTV